MKYCFFFILLLSPVVSFSQGKLVYVSSERAHYSKKQFDSVWHHAGDFVNLKIVNRTRDSIFYSLTHVDRTTFLKTIFSEGKYCGNDKKLPLKTIKKASPFDKLASIKLTSFKPEYDTIYEPEVPMINGVPDLSRMFEVVTLDNKLSDAVANILINYDNKSGVSDYMFCYIPRNAIVFMDNENKVIGFIELCFECQKFKAQLSDIQIGQFCGEKYDALKQIFMAAGIKYGMNSY